MQPLKLHLKYFGPYQDQLIDFQKLTGTPVFLVSGNTGSGKTTIFDAMCYALFGQTTDEQDRDASALRSDFAPVDQETSVIFTFCHQGQTYEITRKPKQELQGRGNKIVEHGTKVSLIYPLESAEPKEINKIGPANQFIEQLLNMTRAQFKQIVLLPQGKFRQFLESSSSDKEDLLRDLFNTRFYEQWAQLLKNQLADLRDTYKETLAKLTVIKSGVTDVDENLSTAAWLTAVAEKIHQRQAHLEEISREITTKQQDVEKINDRVNREQTLLNAFREQRQVEQKLHDLQHQATDIQKVREQVDQLNWYQRHQEKYFHYQTLQQDVKHLQNQQTELQEQLQEFEKAQERLKSLVQHLQNEEPKIEQLQDAANRLKGQLPQYSQIAKFKQEIHKQTQRVNDQQTAVEQQQEVMDKSKRRLQEITIELGKSRDLSQQQLVIAKRGHQLESATNLMDDVQLHVDQQQRLANQIKTLQATINDGQKPILQAQTEYERLKDAHARSEIARLAQDLKPGTPCPVCGSTSHPHLAALAAEQKVITDDVVEKARQNLEQLRQEQTAQQSRLREWQEQELQIKTDQQLQLSRLNDELNVKTDNLNEIKLVITNMKKELVLDEDHIAKRQQLEQQLSSEQGQLQDQQAIDAKKAERLQSTLKQQEVKLAELKASYQTTLRGLQQEFDNEKMARRQLENWQEQITDFQKRQRDCQERQLTNQERLKTTQQSLNELEQSLSQKTSQLKEQHQSLKTILSEYSPTLDWSFWDWAMEQIDALPEMQQQVQRYQAEQTRLESELQRLNNQVDQQTLPKIEKSKQRLAQAQHELAEIQQQSGKVISELSAIQKLYQQVRKLNEQQSKQITHVQNMQTVSDVMNGNTANKLSLERYVLQSYLAEVLRVANERLVKLTNGRYAFKLSDAEAKGNGTKWSGLEINVYDDNAGQERSVRTLSGGESFIASLALALGLGEVIQERSGGIQVETLFIDEGFGSLDQEALNQAMNALQTIHGYKMIGIISHVTELENQIPNQLRVISRNGISHVEYRHEIGNL
ncbi:SMC family ATPase [uncultured Limosilactobacillus sp.]|uniref:AAA family ATPase n=1 Tax=uncultured Limosilactobacillus sp. TaxID=2837629 RepID=UPI0025E3E40A|nr:SMC family ATPase [uncultured Limosilactobacillus sp.]